MRARILLAVVFIAAIAISFSSALSDSGKSVIIVVNSESSSWPDGRFLDHLNDRFAEFNELEIAEAGDSRELIDRTKGRFSKEDAIEHGLVGEHRFILWCEVKREEMKMEKGFAFPFLARQRRVTAHMEVEYRIVDCSMSRVVASDRFKLREHGPSTVQYLDFTDADPNLYVSYGERKEMFDKLELRAADELTKAFAELTHLK